MKVEDGVIRTRRDVRRAIRQFEHSLGDNPGSVRAHLLAAGVQGIPRDPGSCPIARYFRVVIGSEAEVADVSVGLRSIKVVREQPRWPVRVKHSRAVIGFIGAFDSGLYPELLQPDPSGPPAATVAEDAIDCRSGPAPR